MKGLGYVTVQEVITEDNVTDYYSSEHIHQDLAMCYF